MQTTHSTQPLKVAEVAKALNCTTRFVCTLITDGELRAFKLGKKGYRVNAYDLEDWLSRQAVTPKVDLVGEALAEMDKR